LIQHDVTGERIARELLDIIGNPERLAQMKNDLRRVRQLLGAGGLTASENAAEIVMQEVTSVRTVR
jgi:lipid A disaccharide synthetase